MIKTKKAYTFIITSIIIITLISMLLITSRTVFTNNNTKDIAKELNSNYINEFEEFTNNKNNININTLNIFNRSLKNYIKSHNYNTEICSIVDYNNFIYISNYLGRSCDLYIGEDFNRVMEDQTTIKIDKFLNPTNIYLCSCTYINKDIYYIKILNLENIIINKNF